MAKSLSPTDLKLRAIEACRKRIAECEAELADAKAALDQELGLGADAVSTAAPVPVARKTKIDSKTVIVPDLPQDKTRTILDDVVFALKDGTPRSPAAIAEVITANKLRSWPTVEQAKTSVRNVIAQNKGRFEYRTEPTKGYVLTGV